MKKILRFILEIPILKICQNKFNNANITISLFWMYRIIHKLFNEVFYTRKLKRLAYQKGNPDAILQYWKNPWDGTNMPKHYLKGGERSLFLVSVVKKYCKKEFKILEIGCNVGRNLNHLFLNGFKNLSGIEISENAISLLKQSFPEMATQLKIYNIAIEEIIKDFKDNEFDLVYTMAVLEHIHNESDWIFPEIKRITGNILITVEDEQSTTWKHFSRNYEEIFKSLGMSQLEEINCGNHGLSSDYNLRVFKKN